MFGTYWCPYCDKERQALGSDVFAETPAGQQLRGASVLYIECDPTGADAQPDVCRAVGVSAYPTWAVSELSAETGQPAFRLFPGAKGLTGLERLAGLLVEPPAEPPLVLGRSGPREFAVAEALASRGATMYGTYWCSYCDAQRQFFGKQAWAKVPYVECDAAGAGGQLGKCEAAGIRSFPEWALPGGRHLSGLLTLESLEAALAEGDAQPGLGSAEKPILLPIPASDCQECNLNGAGLPR